jgi:hypothetical protein
MALTLEEYKRSSQQMTPTLAGVITVFQDNAPILGEGRNLGYALPGLAFENTTGGKVSFVRQKTLPNVGFRGINQPFAASEGETELISEDLKIAGGRVVYDRILRQRSGDDGLVTQMNMQIAAMSRKWNECFYKGDGTNNTFTGLQNRIGGSEVFDNGGGPLDLFMLDNAMLHWRGENRVLVMGAAMLARITQVAKGSSNVMYTPETFGVSPATYNGVPIMLAGERADESEILDFSEGDGMTSIYMISLGDTGVRGAQTAPLAAYHVEDKVDSDLQIEWDASFFIKTKRSAIRISNIANAAITPPTNAKSFYGAGTGTP